MKKTTVYRAAQANAWKADNPATVGLFRVGKPDVEDSGKGATFTFDDLSKQAEPLTGTTHPCQRRNGSPCSSISMQALKHMKKVPKVCGIIMAL